MHLAAILLAAGGSTRLGSPKQTLIYQGRSLLRRAAEGARAVVDGPVVAVLGAGAGEAAAELAGLDVIATLNPEWERGMGGSVRVGMAQLDRLSSPAGFALDGVLLLLCDQPLVDAAVLARLVAAFQTLDNLDGIAAAAYQDTVGVPVLFGRSSFEDLRYLPEEAGAKGLLRRSAHRVVPVPMPEAGTDIDTRAQYERLVRR